jgi:serine beta-lactamase-like protein LACTB
VKRKFTWPLLIVLGIAVVPLFMMGLWAFMTLTAIPIHPNADGVSSVTQSEPSQALGESVMRARQLVRAHLTERNLPGMSVAVGLHGDLVWAEGFGWADLENRVPVEPDTRFRIGTASVALTSAALGLLLDSGRLKLDDELQTYVPEFPRKQWPVTLRQLMAHTAGIRTDGGDEGPLLSARCERPVEALELFDKHPLLFEPGSRYQYSSYGWILLSAAVEAAAGEPFLTFMRKRIFDPLRMDDTRTDFADAVTAGQATYYFPRFAADPRYGYHLMRELEYSCYAGASAFLSTPSDLVRFGLAVSSGTLLTPATVELLQTPQRLANGEETGYGLGWDIETTALAGRQVRVAGHVEIHLAEWWRRSSRSGNKGSSWRSRRTSRMRRRFPSRQGSQTHSLSEPPPLLPSNRSYRFCIPALGTALAIGSG